MFRLATINDLNEILLITQKAVTKMILIDKLDQWDECYPNKEIFLNDIHNKSLFVLEKDEIIGFAVINQESYQEYNQVKWSSNLEFKTIHRFCVNPEYQNKSIGLELIKCCINQVRDMDIRYIKIDTYSKNIAMNKLLKKAGFVYLSQMDLKPGRALWNCYDLIIEEKNENC